MTALYPVPGLPLGELGGCLAVAILEWKKWGGHCGVNENSRGGNINVSPAWWLSVVMKIALLWLTLSNPT